MQIEPWSLIPDIKQIILLLIREFDSPAILMESAEARFFRFVEKAELLQSFMKSPNTITYL